MQIEATKARSTLDRILGVMRQTFRKGAQIETISPDTTSNDIAGWDSLTHTLFVMALEDEFEAALPMEATLEADNVGDLVKIIEAAL